ncbi:hypothetical protein L1049_025196 [Liquidambar formosana]|uniref:Uncharacterized protein n=1 Tax=Liquidambar formosana TaxID=63359 RepID=A0AAP0RVP7_LIQFO
MKEEVDATLIKRGATFNQQIHNSMSMAAESELRHHSLTMGNLAMMEAAIYVLEGASKSPESLQMPPASASEVRVDGDVHPGDVHPEEALTLGNLGFQRVANLEQQLAYEEGDVEANHTSNLMQSDKIETSTTSVVILKPSSVVLIKFGCVGIAPMDENSQTGQREVNGPQVDNEEEEIGPHLEGCIKDLTELNNSGRSGAIVNRQAQSRPGYN